MCQHFSIILMGMDSKLSIASFVNVKIRFPILVLNARYLGGVCLHRALMTSGDTVLRRKMGRMIEAMLMIMDNGKVDSMNLLTRFLITWVHLLQRNHCRKT